MMISRYLPALLALSLAAPLAAQGFEGTMKQLQIMVMPPGVATLVGAGVTDPQQILDALATKVKGGDPSLVMTSEMTVSVKGAKMRIDGMNMGMAGTGYAIMDAAAGMMYTVVPQQKQIFVLAMADAPMVARRMAEQMGVQPPSTTPAVTTDLGVQPAGGVQAHGYRVTLPEGVGVVWVDPAMKTAFDAFKGMQEKMTGLNPGTGRVQAALMAFGFPMLSQMLTKAPAMAGEGWVYNHVETSEVRRQPVADDLFVVPADYTQVNMAQMPGMS